MERLLSTLKYLFFVALLGAALAGCSGDDSSSSTPAPTTGTLTGTVIEAGIDPALPAVKIAGASVAIFNAKTNAPVATVTTGSDGKYKKALGAGSYYVKVSKQGYDPVPPTTLEPIPFAISVGKTTTNNIEMFPATMTDTGWISGKVSIGDSGKGGVLVVASNGTTAYSALSNKDGSYVIYNVPVNGGAAYSVTSHLAGYSSSSRTDVVVVLNSATQNVNLSLTG
ncbi:MAG TPA: carboxypeptidase-like regulatory domain-containing protein, partial [Gammaproteobacteria bacterium]